MLVCLCAHPVALKQSTQSHLPRQTRGKDRVPGLAEPSPVQADLVAIVSPSHLPLKSGSSQTWQTVPRCMGAQRGEGRCSIWRPNLPNRRRVAFLALPSTAFPALRAPRVWVFVTGTGTLFFWLFIAAPCIHFFGSLEKGFHCLTSI